MDVCLSFISRPLKTKWSFAIAAWRGWMRSPPVIRLKVWIANGAVPSDAGSRSAQKYLAKLTADGIRVVQHPMKYSLEWVLDRNQDRNQVQTGEKHFVQISQSREKGIDILLALDIVLMAVDNSYDTAVIVSQDTDLDVAVAAAFRLVGPKRYLAIENAYIPDWKNKARIAQTTARPLTRVMLEQMGAIQPRPAALPAKTLPPHR